MLTLSFCLILASHLAAAIQDDTTTVFVPENESTELQWSLFIGENAGRSSVNIMIKRGDRTLCQWVKAHGESNRCDPGMNLIISPIHVPGPTNITVTFSFKNKGRSDDGTYECRFVIDEKWHEMQVYPRYLVTTVEPNVTLNGTVSNECNTNFICHVRGGRPKPVETILLKNGTEISLSRLKCQGNSSDGSKRWDCSSIHSVETSGGIYKCRVEHANYSADSAEMDTPLATDDECEQCTFVTLLSLPACIAVAVIASIFDLIMGIALVQAWKRRKHLKRYDLATVVIPSKRERGQFKRAPDIEENEPSIQVKDDQEEPVRLRTGKVSETAVLNQPKSVPSPI